MPNSATRLITLILLLQDQPNQKAADLAERLGISVRMLHRYMGRLDEMGIPVYAERGPHGGFSLLRGFKMPPLVFTLEEAAAVTLGTGLAAEMWGELYHEAAQGALAKLERLLPEEQRQEIAWARRSLVVTGLNRSDVEALAPRLSALRAALRERKAVRMIYLGGGKAEAEERSLDPYVLAHRWGWWYVVGYCHLRQSLRSFRVDRIQTLERLEEGYTIPPDFDARAYLQAEFSAQAGVRASLRFEPQAAFLALSNPSSWEQVEPQPDGSVIVKMLSPDLNWAASSAIALGPGVSVLEPPELRRTVHDWAARIAAVNE